MNKPIGFCLATSWDWPFGERWQERMIYCSQRFDVRYFSAEEFERAGIAFESSLTRAVRKRQAEFLAGRICVARALQALGSTTDALGLNEDRSPRWPDGIVGSITHDSNEAAVVVARACDYAGLGLDVEEIDGIAKAPDIAADVLTPQETDVYESLMPAERAGYLALVFSLKESIFKALYPGVKRYFDFQSARLLMADVATGRAELELCIDLSAQWHSGCRITGLFAFDGERVRTLIALPANH